MRKYLLLSLCTIALFSCKKNDQAAQINGVDAGLAKGTSAQTLADYPANSVTKDGWQLTKQDEFNGTGLNQNLWIPYYLRHRVDDASAYANWSFNTGYSIKLRVDESKVGYGGSGMRVSSIQTMEKNNLHKSGYRDIPTVVKWTQQFGYFEIRAKLQGGSGHNNIFWLAGQQNTDAQTAEIDILEKPGHWATNKFKFNLYRWKDYSLTNPTDSITGQTSGWSKAITVAPDVTNTFNIYALEWTPTQLKLYFNNQLVETIDKSPQYPMIAFLSLYENRTGDWYGKSTDANGVSILPYPKAFEIDYFRVYKRP